MTLEERIKKKLCDNLNIQHIELINESHKHTGHIGDDGSGQTHFKLKVVSSGFEGCDRVSRQKVIHSIVKEEFSMGLHALSMQLLTPNEYN